MKPIDATMEHKAEELAELEYFNTLPHDLLRMVYEAVDGALRYNEVLDVAKVLLKDKWMKEAQERPEWVIEQHKMSIGFDGFEGE